jgi:hypothetical protein
MGIAKLYRSATPPEMCVSGDKALAERGNPQVAEATGVASAEDGGTEPAHDFDLYTVGYELVALNSVVAELGGIIAAVAPGAIDRALATTRIRLQQITTGRTEPVTDAEDLVLRFRISLLERILGKPQSQF